LGADNDNNTFTNNYLIKARYGIIGWRQRQLAEHDDPQNLIGPAAFSSGRSAGHRDLQHQPRFRQ
jgi:hypothetical protein